MMERVIVIGCPGSGKSTFSRALAEKTGLPLYHLDLMYWNADRTTVPREQFRSRLEAVLAQRSWIVDGNYGGTMELRLAACDTVFFLDYPTDVCLSGLTERRGRARPDLPWVEREGETDEEFVSFVRAYATESRPRVLELLARYRDRRVIVFHSRDEADAYLSTL